MMRIRRAMTFIELLLTMVLMSILLLVTFGGYTFFFSNIEHSMGKVNSHMQIDYALEKIRLHLVSATDMDEDSYFPLGKTAMIKELGFIGESDPFNITPDNSADNTHYRIYVTDTGPVTGLVLETMINNQKKYYSLIEKQFSPRIEFRYAEGSEPNFMTVFIEAGTARKKITKTEGIQFWFIDIVK